MCCPPPVFQWPHHASTLSSIRESANTQLGPAMVEKLQSLGIYRSNEERTGSNIEGMSLKYKSKCLESLSDVTFLDAARATGLNLRRKSIRISFDAFMSKSRPGLEISEDEIQAEKENRGSLTAQQVNDKRKEKQFGNVRRRKNSWSEKQKINKQKPALRTKSLTFNQ